MTESSTRKHPVSVAIYKRHIRLYRYLNDAWIFVSLLRPELDGRAKKLLASKVRKDRKYPVPKRNQNVTSRRNDSEIGQIFRAQHDRGIFETTIVSVVSRVEAFI